MARRLKRFGFVFLINFVILVPLVYAVEFFLERTDPKRSLPANGWVNGEMITWGHQVETNRVGFREREFVTPKPPGVFRIMVLGDSLTWGAGLAPEERYTNLLEKALNESNSGKRFEVLNFAQPAGSTIDESNILRKYKDLTQPDLIVVGFCFNDPQPKSQNYSPERQKFETTTARRLASVKYRLGSIGLPEIAELIKNASFGFAEKTKMIPTWPVALDRTYVKSSIEWQDFVNALKDIKRMSDEMKLPAPIFAALNQGEHTGQDYAKPDEMIGYFIKWTRQAEQAAGEAGFKTLDYEREIPVELANDSLVLNVLDAHPSAKLNQLYSRKLLVTVAAELGLEDRSRSVQTTK